jgi:F-type H+/Na+-transporting ATPase subunit alpha
MKSVAGRLKLDLAQYREVEAFAQFGSDLDQATQRQLARGERFVAALNQPQYQPWPVEDQVAIIWAATNGYLDDVPVDQVPRFNEELRAHLRAEKSILEEIRSSGALNDALTEKLKKAIDEFKEGFEVRDSSSIAAD